MNPYAVDVDLYAQLPTSAEQIQTDVFVQVCEWPSGKITSCSHKDVSSAKEAAEAINNGAAGKRVIARLRVPFTCIRGQFDV